MNCKEKTVRILLYVPWEICGYETWYFREIWKTNKWGRKTQIWWLGGTEKEVLYILFWKKKMQDLRIQRSVITIALQHGTWLWLYFLMWWFQNIDVPRCFVFVYLYQGFLTLLQLQPHNRLPNMSVYPPSLEPVNVCMPPLLEEPIVSVYPLHQTVEIVISSVSYQYIFKRCQKFGFNNEMNES